MATTRAWVEPVHKNRALARTGGKHVAIALTSANGKNDMPVSAPETDPEVRIGTSYSNRLLI